MRIRGWCLSLLYLIQSFAKKVGIAASSDDKPARHIIITYPDLPPPVTSLEYADLATPNQKLSPQRLLRSLSGEADRVHTRFWKFSFEFGSQIIVVHTRVLI